MDFPKVIWPPVFLDNFRYRGKELPGSESLPSHWNSTGSWTTSNEKQLIATNVNSNVNVLLYTGTPLNELITGMSQANFAWVIRFFGQKNLIFSILVRHSGLIAPTFVDIEVDFINNALSIKSQDVTSTTIATRTYKWKTSNIAYYSVESHILGTKCYVFVNGNPALSGTIPIIHSNNFGFGLQVNPGGFPASGAKFSKMAVHEIIAHAEPQIMDNSYLPGLFRQQMKIEIEKPNERTWESFLKARKLYDFHKSLGLSNAIWEKKGYPIREPLPEEWFVGPG